MRNEYLYYLYRIAFLSVKQKCTNGVLNAAKPALVVDVIKPSKSSFVMLERLDRAGAFILLALFICVPAYFLLAKKLGFKYRKQLFGTRKIDGKSSAIPMEGDLIPAFFVLSNQERVGADIRYHELTIAFFFHWIFEGRVKIASSVPGEAFPGYLFPEKGSPDNEVEKKLFNGIRKGAGSDLILTRYEAYKWGRKHFELFHKEMFTEQVYLWLEKHNYIEKYTKFNVFLNPEGAAEARKVVELENYLNALTAGEAVEMPDPEKVSYYIEFAVLMRRLPEFLNVLEEHPDSCTRVAEILGCDKNSVVSTLKEASVTIGRIIEGIEDETDKVIEKGAY